MPAAISGLPLHPLLVHAVVVLVPLSALGSLAMAVSSRVRDRFGWLFLGLTTLALLSVPLATSSGEALRARVPLTPAIEHHADMAELLLPLMALLWVAVAAMAVSHRWSTLPSHGPGTPAATLSRPSVLAPVDRVGQRLPMRRRRVVQRLAAVAAVVLAVLTAVQVYRIGDSGARAVWHNVGTGPVVNAGDG